MSFFHFLYQHPSSAVILDTHKDPHSSEAQCEGRRSRGSGASIGAFQKTIDLFDYMERKIINDKEVSNSLRYKLTVSRDGRGPDSGEDCKEDGSHRE